MMKLQLNRLECKWLAEIIRSGMDNIDALADVHSHIPNSYDKLVKEAKIARNIGNKILAAMEVSDGQD